MNPDVTLFHWINNFAGTSPLLDTVTRALVNDYALPTLFALISGAVWFAGADDEQTRLNQRGVLYALIGIALANVLIKLFQLNFFRPRPFATETVKLLFYRPSVSSFPSEPVATMFCFVTGMWRFNRPVARGLLVVTLLFSAARVLAGVHYPSDILGGAVIGILCVWLPLRWSRHFDIPVNGFIRLWQHVNLA
jgi:undecaprenyl-diphosphatase